jgi:hypothetical protein
MPERSVFSLQESLVHFLEATLTQDQDHINQLHWHIAARLVIEGGFRPDDIVPRPPLRLESTTVRGQTRHLLIYDESAARPGEQTILGGLKTKNVDVVVCLKGIGPCLAISVKGTMNAFRNLTNRMEEAAGDCTNLHIAYPTLVYGFLHAMRATREAEGVRPNDVAIGRSGAVNEGILRYHDAMARLTARADLRNDVSRYESISLILVDTEVPNRGAIYADFPGINSALRFDGFFASLYRTYDLRFVYAAKLLQKVTRRLEWAADSPAFAVDALATFMPRIGSES